MRPTLLLLLILPFVSAGAPGALAPSRPAFLQGVGIDQKLNSEVPLDVPFSDESSHTVTLRRLVARRPAIPALVYYTCPALCDQILHGIARGLRPLSLTPGRDFNVIAISINPSERPADAGAKRNEILEGHFQSGSSKGWHFLTGSEASIGAIADQTGFHYRYDSKSKMFFHPAAIMVLTPEGRVSRYLYGVDFEPKDLKLALIEASRNRLGTTVDQILLYCYHYDPLTGKYTATVLNLLHVAAALFLIGLVGLLALLWRLDLRFQKHASTEVGHR